LPVDDFESILSTAYPITYSCYYSLDEYNQITRSYIGAFKDPKVILFNVMRNARLIDDTIYFWLKLFHTDTSNFTSDYEHYNYWYKMGSYSGLILYLTLYNFGYT
jgi:hypothetical protein